MPSSSPATLTAAGHRADGGFLRRPARGRGRRARRPVRAARHGEPQSGASSPAMPSRWRGSSASAIAASCMRLRARRGWSALCRRPHDRGALPHHLVRGISRPEPAQARLQQRDGARRAGDRAERPDRRHDLRAPPGRRRSASSSFPPISTSRASIRPRLDAERVDAARAAWGVGPDTRVIMVRRPHPAPQGSPRRRAGRAPAQGHGAARFRLRARRRGHRPFQLQRRIVGPGAWRPRPPT